jgi:hypothetical protein
MGLEREAVQISIPEPPRADFFISFSDLKSRLESPVWTKIGALCNT